MKLKNFFKNRFTILYIIIIFLLFLLGFKLAVLTIVDGESYREQADIKKIKDIPVKASRGRIYDRNGILLADNVTSFTVQMYTDEIPNDKINQISYTMSKIFDENNESPIDEFSIELYTFDYINEEKENVKLSDEEDKLSYNVYKTAHEKAIELVKTDIVGWLNFQEEIFGEMFNPKEKTLHYIKKYMDDFPVKLENGEFVYVREVSQIVNNDAKVGNDSQKIEETDSVKVWLQNNNFNVNLTPISLIQELLVKENKYLMNLFSNSKVRKFSYDFLQSRGLTDNIKLIEYSFVQDENFKNIKRNLKLDHKGITDTSLAKDDFVLLTMKYSFDNLVHTVYVEKDKTIVPGDILINNLKEIYSDLPVEFINRETYKSFEYTQDQEAKNKYLSQLNMNLDTPAFDFIKSLAIKDYSVLYNFITDDSIKYYAQTELLKFENPYISVYAWEYSPIVSKKQWIEANLSNFKKDEDVYSYSAKEVFEKLREALKIDKDINDYDARNIMVLRERFKKPGYMSYHPIDVCYGVSEKTVAMLSERSHELNGMNVEIEPLRYYPEHKTGAHILGYLGKISQDYEIEEYVKKNGYSPEDIIGKTGVEENFEEYLRGKKGKKTVEVNNVGKTIKSVSSEYPIPGDDLYLTIDLRLQESAERNLKKGLEQLQVGGTFESEWGNFPFKDPFKNAKSGALVAVDVKTGELLAMANYPSYDLNMFATGVSQEDWNSLLTESKDPLAPRPLYNISMLTAIQPGSTFKMVTALAALEKGVDPNTKVYCSGTMEVGDRHFSCWIYNMYRGSHGYQNMYEAIMNSCNFYFYTTVLGENLATKQPHTVMVTADDIINTAGMLGLNDKTGVEISIPKEFSDGVPSKDGKRTEARWYLRMFLESNVDKYLEDGYVIDGSMRNEIIEEIVSWVDHDEIMTRGEVYTGLQSLRLNPDKTNDKGIPLVDIIKYSYLNQATWKAGDNLNISIGQGSNAYTPLQMANYVATIASGGYRKNISLVKEIKTYDQKPTDYVPLRESELIPLNDYSHLDVLKYSMLLVSEADSAKPYSKFPVKVGSKTGTAEKEGINPETGEGYADFAWYVAFAPYDDPQIAVACVLVQGGLGRNPTPIVREVIGEYLKNNGLIE